MKDNQVIELNNENFDEEVLGHREPMLVECYSETSYITRELSGIFDQRAEEFGGRVRICRFDVDARWQKAESLEVNTSPTVLIVKNGKVIEQITYLHTRAEYRQAIHEVISQNLVI